MNDAGDVDQGPLRAAAAQLRALEAQLDDVRALRLAGDLLMAGALAYLGFDSLRAGRRNAAAIEFSFAAAIAGFSLYQAYTTRRPRAAEGN